MTLARRSRPQGVLLRELVICSIREASLRLSILAVS